MQVLASHRPLQGRPSRVQVWSAYSVGFLLVGAALTLLYLIFVAGYLERFTPSGRPTTFQLVAGALAWAFALTAPAGAGLLGVLRLATARDRQQARRARITPAVRLARAIGDDHIVATGLQLPDGSRIVPELVVGPFGAAVIHELPPAGAVMSRGVRSWEVRVGNGQIRTIENRSSARPATATASAHGSPATTTITSSRSTPPSSAPIRGPSGARPARSSHLTRSPSG